MASPKMAELNMVLISEEINTILAKVLGKFLVKGSPTKHGGLRFLDVQSANTFGFESSTEYKTNEEKGNLVVISAPVNPGQSVDAPDEPVMRAEARIQESMAQGPHAELLRSVQVRPSRDPGKKKKYFVYVQYLIKTCDLLEDDAVIDFAKRHAITSTSEAVKRILREAVEPVAEETMNHLITVIRNEPTR